MKPFTLQRKIAGALFSALLLLCSITCSPALAQQATPQSSPILQQAQSANEKADAQKRQESFELVWKTVNQRFYDPTFGGVDWNKVRERYAPLVARVNNDQELHLLLQQMLNELHQSHFVIIPKESIPKFIPKHRSSNADSNEADVEDDSFETDKESAVLESTISEKWYFDVQSGPLLRKGTTYYEDYREVDGVKLPFTMRDDSGFGFVVRLSEIKHNVVIDPEKFVEYPDCFTKPEQGRREQKTDSRIRP